MSRYRIKVRQEKDRHGKVIEIFTPQYKVLNLYWYSFLDGDCDTEAEARGWISKYQHKKTTRIIEVD